MQGKSRSGIGCSAPDAVAKGTDMSRLLWLLMMRFAGLLDRRLLTVPEVDDPSPPPADPGEPPMTGQIDSEAEWTRQIRRALISSHRVSRPTSSTRE